MLKRKPQRRARDSGGCADEERYQRQRQESGGTLRGS
jgi:hypothetical protein